MKITDFKWMTKNTRDVTENSGRQIVLDYGNYHLSIIDDGYGRDEGLYEIGVFKAQDGVATEMINLPGITNDGDSVKGHLTEEEVDVILRKMETITRTHPTQV